MADLCSRYDFCGAALRVTADDAGNEEAFRLAFRHFAVAAGADHDHFTLAMTTGVPGPPEGMSAVWRGDLPEGGAGLLFETEERCALTVDEACLLDIDPANRAAVAVIAPGGTRRFMGSASMLLLDFVLGAFGRQLVHAACLVNPRTDGAVLIFAPSGSGKTSTAIALGRGGFRLMTDDASVLSVTGGPAQAWGLPRALKVHRRTADLMSWLKALLRSDWDGNGEQPVSLPDIASHVALCAPIPRTVEAVVVLGEKSAGPHRLTRIEKRAALVEMAADNVPWYLSGAPMRAARKFEALARVMAHASVFRLHAGTDLDGLPALLTEALKDCGDAAA
jgi:hypothetical protein